VGRRVFSAFLPQLKGLSDEEVASEPEYRTALGLAGAALPGLMVGLAILLLGWLVSPSLLLRWLVDPKLLSSLSLLLDWPANGGGIRVDTIARWIGFIASAVGLAGLGLSFVTLTVVLNVRSRATSPANEAFAADPAFRDIERVQQERAALEARLFQRNLNDEFNLKTFDWQGVSFFEDDIYRFAPRINVLLGKNGYGKTLLFRSLTAMLQRNPEYSGLLFAKMTDPGANSGAAPAARLKVEVTRNGNTEHIIRDVTYFDDSKVEPVGRIPMLAIPDSRFLNRTRRTVAGAASGSEPLSGSGAKSYLTQEPFENVVQDLLTQLCLDYIETPGSSSRAKGFDRQIFRLVEEVVRELTEDQDFRFSEIRRIGTSGFEILVRTSGSQTAAIPIQSASQGTLSVVAIFGLIYSFLHSLRPTLSEDRLMNVSAIVLIDEIDAHLHPSWQQKILGMLLRKFPNVQFIVSAHSPAIVAGCDKGEVSVLRKRPDSGKFYVDTLPEDFLGTSVRDLYTRVFEIEDVDRLYLEYTAKDSTEQQAREREITRLDKKKRRTPQEEERLNQLLREARLIDRAAEVREQRLRSVHDQTKLAMLDGEVERLRDLLQERENEIAQLKEGASNPSGEGANALS
jgi:predicted ATPase